MRTFATHTMGTLAMVAGLAVPATTAAETPAQPAPLLVDAAWLSQHLKDPSLVILHVGPRPTTTPGTFLARGSSPRRTWPGRTTWRRGELMLELPPLDGAARQGGARSASPTTAGSSSTPARTASLQSATRIVFTLDYLGLGDRTSLLNGGLAAWRAAGQPARRPTCRAVDAAAR